MNDSSCPTIQNSSVRQFGFFRLTKAREAVDCCPNTLRKYHDKDGLPFYRKDDERAVWVRYDEVEAVLYSRRVCKTPKQEK